MIKHRTITEIQGTFTTDYIKHNLQGIEIPTTTEIILIEPDVPFEEIKRVPRPKQKFGWYCVGCKEMNPDDDAKECAFCHLKRKY